MHGQSSARTRENQGAEIADKLAVQPDRSRTQQRRYHGAGAVIEPRMTVSRQPPILDLK
jgi:hypothetical protein